MLVRAAQKTAAAVRRYRYGQVELPYAGQLANKRPQLYAPVLLYRSVSISVLSGAVSTSSLDVSPSPDAAPANVSPAEPGTIPSVSAQPAAARSPPAHD